MASFKDNNVVFSTSIRNPDLNATRVMRRNLEDFDFGVLPSEIRGAFSFFVAEVVTNLIEHAQPMAENVTVELSSSAGAWICRVIDDGAEFEDFQTNMAESLENWETCGGMQESGSGLAMITKMLPDYWYETSAANGARKNSFGVRYPPRKSVLTRPRVTIVDDDILIRLLARVLLQENYCVRCFPDAVTALERFHDAPVDLVIADVQMPVMDGLEFRKKLSEQGDDLIPFIFLTASSEEAVAQKADDLGIDAFLQKSSDTLKIPATVNRLLNRRRSMQERLWKKMGAEITDSLGPGLQDDDSPLTQIGPWDCAVRNRVASIGGGDLCLKLGDNSVFIADVMGHGLGAKMIAHSVAAYARGLASAQGENWGPGELMAQISNAIARDRTLDSIIISALLAKVMPDGMLHVSSAGHPFPIRLESAGYGHLKVGGPLLGMDVAQTYDVIEFAPNKSSALLFLTDGLFEISSNIDDQKDMEKEFCRAAGDLLSEDVNVIADSIMSVFDRKTNKNPADDATICLMKFG